MLAELTLVLRSAIGAEPAAVSLRLRRLLRITLRGHLSGVTLLRHSLSGIALLLESLLRVTLLRHLSGVALLRVTLLLHTHTLLLESLLRITLLLLHAHTLLLESKFISSMCF